MTRGLKLIIIMCMLILASCSKNDLQGIPIDKSISATINIKDMSISFIDMKEQRVLTTWKLDHPYTGGMLMGDQDRLLLFGKSLDHVDIYSLSHGEKLDSWETGTGIVNAIKVNNGKEIAMADQDRNSIRFFTEEGRQTKEVKTEKNPLTLLESKNKKLLYIISFNHDYLSIIDIHSKMKRKGFQIHSAAAGAILNDELNELWIGGHGAGADLEDRVHVYDLNSGKLKKEIQTPFMPISFARMNEHYFVLSHGSNTLYKLNNKGEVEETGKIGANPFEVELLEGKLMITGYDSNELYIVNPDGLTIEKTVKVGKGPFHIVIREGS